MTDSGPSSSDARDLKIGRILSDLHDRRACGETVNDEDVIAAHPDLADELRNHLRTLCELRLANHTIEGLIRRGWLTASADEKYAAEFGPYKIIEPLGRGGMGIVLKAYDEALRRFVAIKLLRPDVADDERALARFTREAQTAAALAHPNIVGVFSVGHERGAHFIAMEYVDGPSLAQLIRERGPLPVEAIRSLFTQLLEGLAAAHNAGLIHRDVKSANLLLAKSRDQGVEGPRGRGTEDGEAHGSQSVGLKIADFGLARMTTSQTRLTLPEQSFGTPEYMSPEQARGDNQIDARTDLYSAGVVLYEMLTGRVPFKADSPTAVVHQILHAVPVDPRSVYPQTNPALSSLALRLMAKRREDRLDSAADALDAVHEKLSVIDREKRRRHVRVGMGCLITLGAVIAAGVLVRRVIFAAPSGKKFVAVRVESKRFLQGMMEQTGEWRLLHTFPESITVTGAALADVDGQGDRIAIASINPPQNGDCLVAFESSGKERWRMNLSSPRRWPDCGPPNGYSGLQVMGFPLDNDPGDELVVVASDVSEYPTRVSILDPRTIPPIVRGTFWNFGDIPGNEPNETGVQMINSFFPDHRPAILAVGLNNKLDGFEFSNKSGLPSWTKWNIVPAAMILDPAEIMRLGECVGPPATDLVDLPRGGVYAYAFLNLAFDSVPTTNVDLPGRRSPRLHEQGSICNILASGAFITDGRGPRFNASIDSKRGDGILLQLDRNLRIESALTAPSRQGRSTAEWRSLWVQVVEGGRWLQPAARQ